MEEHKVTHNIGSIDIANNQLPHNKFINRLKSFLTGLSSSDNKNFSSYPVVIGEDNIKNSETLCNIINSVLVLFAYNYIRDVRLQQLYQLDKELNEILLMANGVPYEVGMYKPIFNYMENGQPKISQFSCTHPLNGWIISNYLNEATKDLANQTNSNWKAIEDQNEFSTELKNRLDLDDKLFLIQTNKENTDVLKELKNLGIDTVLVQPGDFTLENNELKVGNSVARQFFLEMNSEDLKLFDKDVLKMIVQSGRCINDVRTMILMEDKRVLVALFNNEIMGSYINMDDHALLTQYLTPSFTVNTDDDINFLANTQDDWVLKKNTGPETYHKKSCSKEAWEEILKNHPQEYIAQPYFEQKKFSLTTENSEESVYLEGQDLYFNAKSFGPGFFKASSDTNNAEFILPRVIEKTS